MRYFILAILFLIPCISYSQVKDSTKVGTVAGIIKDSVNGFPLQSVTITVYKKADSALLDFQLSNNAGEFSFPSLPLATPLIFSFSYVGFKSNSALVNIDTISRKYDLKNILLSRGHEMLEGVVVEAVVPIRMNGETLEINPAAFKVDENAVVEDMLRR
ncbi:MAG TPA: carboxypeptidase-like regulatory domain-containing protein, partial [Niabella sp.]|nr:carboxypeptidase-like regulatory domain-containing protein [Niabella sp.]